MTVLSSGINLPFWLGAIASLFVIAAALGSAVAIYRTSLQSTALRESDAANTRLRDEIADYQRRELEMAGDIRVLKAQNDSKEGRIRVLEDLINKRQDDDEIRREIATIKKVVDENVISQLTALTEAVTTLVGKNNGGATNA